MEERINFLNDLKTLFSLIPEDCFRAPHDRENLLNAAQIALDEAIAEEEEEFE